MTEQKYIEKYMIPTEKLKLIIDTDAKNEVDDQFAIAWALRSEDRFSVEAIYAAPFSTICCGDENNKKDVAADGVTTAVGMEKSYEEIHHIYDLMNISDTSNIYRGSTQYIRDNQPVISEAAEDLVHRARAAKETLYIAACGVLTNIASAIMMAPDIVDKIFVVWLGGQPVEFGHGIEFNLMQDVKATQVVLDSKVPLVVIPCMSVASSLTVTEDELKANLKGKNAICDYLYEIVTNEFSDINVQKDFMKMDRSGYLKGCEDYSEEYLAQFTTEHISWSRIVWDVAVIAFLKNPNWIVTKMIPAPILHEDLRLETSADRHMIKCAKYCWRDFIFGDLFHCIRSKEA